MDIIWDLPRLAIYMIMDFCGMTNPLKKSFRIQAVAESGRLDLKENFLTDWLIWVHTKTCQKCLIFCVRVPFRCKKLFPGILISQLCLLQSCTAGICLLSYQAISVHPAFGKIEVGMPGIEPGTSRE